MLGALFGMGHRLSRMRSRAIFAVDKAFAFSISRNVARGALLSPTESAKLEAKSIEAPSYWRMSVAHVLAGAAVVPAGFVCAVAGTPAGTIASAAIVARYRINPPITAVSGRQLIQVAEAGPATIAPTLVRYSLPSAIARLIPASPPVPLMPPSTADMSTVPSEGMGTAAIVFSGMRS